MIKHLLKIIWNQRKSNLWIGLELLVVYVCVWYIVDYYWTAGNVLFAPTGLNTEHTYRAELRLSGDECTDLTEEELADLQNKDFNWIVDNIRRYSPIESVSLSVRSCPFSTLFSSYPVSLNKDTVTCTRWDVTGNFFRVFKCLDEESMQRVEISRSGCKTIVINQVMADHFFPNGDAVGNYLSDHLVEQAIMRKNNDWDTQIRKVDERLYIAAVVPAIRSHEYERNEPAYFKLMTDQELNKNLYFLTVCLRVKPEEDRNFIERFKKELGPDLSRRTFHFGGLRPLSDYHRLVVKENVNELRMRTAILLFLFVNVFLGVIGTFWIRTRRRRCELGIRMALGSTKKQLRWLMVGEGLMLLLLAMFPAILICLNMVFAELPDTSYMDLTLERTFISLFITTLLMALMVIVGILYPANASAKIQPAEVLHEE